MVDEYYIQVNTLNEEITMLTNNNSDCKSQITNLENQITNMQEQVNNLTTIKFNNEETISQLNTRITNLQNEITALENSNDNKDLTIAQKNSQIASLNALIDELEKINESNLSTIGGLNNQIALQKSQIADLQNQVLNNDTSIYELNTTISNLQKSVTYYENYIFELENANHFVGIFEFNGSTYKICEADDTGKVNVDNPTSTEYVIFNYWMVEGVRVDLDTYTLQQNTKFVANVTYMYKVKFLVDEDIYDTQVIQNGNKVSIPNDPTKDKYDFLGWSVDGTNIVDLSTHIISSDVCFIAIFQSTYGLFNPDTGALQYSWQELQDYNYISVEDNTLSAGVNVKRLSGNLVIDNDITSIATSTFRSCAGLVTVNIPANVTSIGETAFYGCSSLISITIPECVTSIGHNAFYGCSSLNFNIYDNAEYLGNDSNPYLVLVKATSTSITSCVINENCKIIYSSAFRSCLKLTSVTIPESVKCISVNVFYQCSNLVSVIFENTTGWYVTTSHSYSNVTSISVTEPSTNATNLNTGIWYNEYIYQIND